MKLDAAFRVSSILLAVCGFAGIVLTGELPAGLSLLGASALAISLAQAAGYGADWPLFTLSHRVWTGIIIVAFAAMLMDLFWISGDLLQAGTHFLVVLMTHKLLTLRERKDFLHLYAISLMELLAAAALTMELWYAAVFGAYLLAAIWTLLLYHLRSEAEEVQLAEQAGTLPADPSRHPGPITGRFFWSTNGIAVGAFCLTLLIFFITPRIGAGFFQKNRTDLIRTSGFSEQVDLGMVGSVKLDDTVVMRVEFPDRKGPLAERVYFRGAAYDVYNGRSWSNTLGRRRPLGRSAEGEFLISGSQPVDVSAGLRQEILAEALDTPILFGAPFVESVKGPFPVVQADGMGSVSLPYSPATRFQYSVRSIPIALSTDDRLRTSATYPGSVRERFLQLPPMGRRVVQLARQVAVQAKSPFEKAVAIERYLQESYEYSLDIGLTQTASPVEDFLFTRKTGYCDHYATAMVLLLRALGIPSRLATGFLQGEWNDVGNYYTVRQRDAHAWVEVYFPHSGWATFDPTPMVLPAPPNPLWASMGKMVDSLRLKWDRFIIRYSFRDQMAIAQGIRERSDAVRVKVATGFASVVRWGAELRTSLMDVAKASRWLLFACLAVLALAWVLFVRKYRGLGWGKLARHGVQASRQMAIIRVYARMLASLESRGLGKAPGSTPLEFARLVAREWAAISRFVDPLTELYCRVRFGHAPLLSEDLQQAQALLTGLRATPRH